MIHYSIIYAYECCEYDELTRDDLLLLCDWYASGSPESEIIHDLRAQKSETKTPFKRTGDQYPKTKVCPECGGEMRLELNVEDDECPYGDPEDGDWELATTASWIYECQADGCRNWERVGESETKRLGVLR